MIHSFITLLCPLIPRGCTYTLISLCASLITFVSDRAEDRAWSVIGEVTGLVMSVVTICLTLGLMNIAGASRGMLKRLATDFG